MNQRTLDRLEFDSIRELLAGHCACALGKRLSLGIKPTTNAALVRDWLKQTNELLSATVDHPMPPFAGVHDIRDLIRATAFPVPLEAESLARIADTLAATAHIRAWFASLGDDAPSVHRLGRQVADHSALASAIREVIDEKGRVRDYASPKLASIRRSMEEAKTRVKTVFDRMVRQPTIARMLQYAGATFDNDRMVLPLKSEYRGRVAGIVHRTSDSGATLFVEPTESVELNNTLVRLRDEESKEITRILGEITRKVRAVAGEILTTLRALGALDLIAAKCRYARKRALTCADVDEAGAVVLHDARHPLLLELFDKQESDQVPIKQVVPIDVRLGEDFDVMVITGPNTGGKTVTLKTVGLLALMHQCGLPIPAAAGSKLPVFDEVFLDIGDEQSLQQSLSTFSSHLAMHMETLRRASRNSLVLMDELGAGTDPDEGAAIGRAIIGELLKIGARVIVTTHLSALKAAAFTTDRVDNASVEFDPESLKPTFRLRIGEPGNSNALIIAKRLGMPSRLIQQAKSFLDDRSGALNKAIAATLGSRREAEDARRKAVDAARESQQLRDEHFRAAEELRKKEEAFSGWTKWIEQLTAGDWVFLRNIKRNGTVIRMQLHKQLALISVGALDLEVPIRDLTHPEVD